MIYHSIEIRRFEIIALTMLLSFSVARAQEENAAVCLFQPRSIPVYAPYYKVYYPPSKGKGGLVFGAEYSMWIPAGVKTLRGIIVHQHGCGPGAAKQGETAVYDLHWQALAEKWDCALMGPSYKETEGFDYRLKEDCRMWSDPRNGSEETFLRSLKDLGKLSGHPELEKIPWVLWGHSGGGGWSGVILSLHPERVVAVWFRSGIPNPVTYPGFRFTKGSMQVPCMLNPGVKERDEDLFAESFKNNSTGFIEFRKEGALIGYAPDPLTSHECGNARYLAIPFFDYCLSKRLPHRAGDVKLKNMPKGIERPIPFLTGTKLNVWLPDEKFARKWEEFIQTGYVLDNTPPPAPENVKITGKGEITWDISADLESGLAGFIIERDGKEIARLPDESKIKTFGKPIFQKETYGDTPFLPLPQLAFRDKGYSSEGDHIYQVVAINTSGLRSKKSQATKTDR